MLSLLLWSILSLLLAFGGLIAFLWFLALFYSDTFLCLRKNLHRSGYFRYAKKYGFKAANKEIHLAPWVLDPWEQHLLEAAPEPTEAQFLAYAWYHHLKLALGLLPAPAAGWPSRWQCFKRAVLGFLLDYGLVRQKPAN
jgi:hypothetical protein